MNIFGLFERRVGEALERLSAAGTIPPGIDTSRVLVEPPRDASHGDLATNAAMAVAKAAKANPRQLAELIARICGVTRACERPRSPVRGSSTSRWSRTSCTR
jgi:arginyl-tRNA synthetase